MSEKKEEEKKDEQPEKDEGRETGTVDESD